MATSPFDREMTVFKAKMAEQAERYEDMAEEMKTVAKSVEELTADERIMLSVGYHKMIMSRRVSLTKLKAKIMEEATVEEPDLELRELFDVNVDRIDKYAKKVQKEITNICKEVLSIINKHLISSYKRGDSISLVFYLKMRGDYYRYLAKIGYDADKIQKDTNESSKAYEAAMSIASAKLPTADPIRLGLALNFSVLYADVFGCVERSCEIAKQASEEAESGLASLNEEELKDSTKIMQLLKANMVIWEAELAEDDCIANAYAASI